MKKILSVDSNPLNSKVLEKDIKEYFDSINEEFEFYETRNEKDALTIIKKEIVDILLIDISSKKYDGINLLKEIKYLEIRQPKVVAVTTLEDHFYRFEALKLKVFRYIYKPYDNKEIHEVFSKFFDVNYYAKEINREEHFINIDDIAENFDEIDAENTDLSDEELVTEYNDKHKKIDAKEFLGRYEGWDISTMDLDDLEFALERVLMNILQNDDFEAAMPDIILMLKTYNTFLYMFVEFEELCRVLYALTIQLEDMEFESVANKVMVTRFIVTSLQDLVDWKEAVFIDQIAEDVYYINDAILNSYVQIQDLVS